MQWTLQLYWHYALIVLLITTGAACISIVISRQNFRRLRDLSHHEALVTVRRGAGEPRRVLSTELVPGDVVEVEENMDLPCDGVLVSGECLVSEAMLTGESVPVAKTAASPGPVPAKALLSGGTRVLQTRSLGGGPVLARCMRTGFSTEKGRLIRSILFPRAGRLDLTRDGNRFVAFVLVPMAVAGGIASCAHALNAGNAFTVASALDLISIAVPPALPAAMMIGVATAVDRLRRRAVFCIAPSRVNMAGRVTRVCFDKTGTLTYDGLTMMSVRPLNAGAEADPACVAVFGEELPAAALPEACAQVAAASTPLERLTVVMAACQSLRTLSTSRGEETLVGDPLEVVCLQCTGWLLHAGADGAMRVRAPSGGLCAAQLQAFDFSSDLARMAVVVHLTQGTTGEPAPQPTRVLVKGAPEAVAALCHAASVPPDFAAVLAFYAGRGYRVIGCAERTLGAGQAAAAAAGKLTRDAAEGAGELRFLGLVVMENKLKPCSAGVIAALQAAAVGVCMVTGDHARTAVTVAKAANIMARDASVVLCDAAPGGAPAYTRLAQVSGEADEALSAEHALGVECDGCRFVATGAGFDALHAAAAVGAPQALTVVLGRLSVAARFQPVQKQSIVHLYIERGDYTAFVGDGANDSAALKAADVGLSLTADAEASVAAPFTSKDANLESCITLLLEGRASIATSFQMFKFMSLYAFVQFSCSLQMDLSDTYLSELEFLWVDLAVVLPLSALLPQTRAYHVLTPRRPPPSLLHWSVVASVAGQAAVCLGFQLAIRALTRAQCWWQLQDFQCCGRPAAIGAHQPAVCPLRAPAVDAGSCVTCGDAFAQITPGFENTALWQLANTQYLCLAACFAMSAPFRQPQWTNAPFSLYWLGALGATVAFMFADSRALEDAFELIRLPDYNFRWAIACLSLLSALCSFGLEASLEVLQAANQEQRGPAALLARARAARRGMAYAPLA
jgi:predicted P-type ATPase